MTASLKRITRTRADVQKAAEQALRSHYRLHRRIRWGPLSSLVGMRRVQTLIFWGEFEHRLRIVAVLLVMHRLFDAMSARLERHLRFTKRKHTQRKARK